MYPVYVLVHVIECLDLRHARATPLYDASVRGGVGAQVKLRDIIQALYCTCIISMFVLIVLAGIPFVPP